MPNSIFSGKKNALNVLFQIYLEKKSHLNKFRDLRLLKSYDNNLVPENFYGFVDVKKVVQNAPLSNLINCIHFILMKKSKDLPFLRNGKFRRVLDLMCR